MATSKHLVLPHEHALSLRLALQAPDLQLTKNVLSCRVLSPGLVEIMIQAGDELGYGSRSWPLRVGGAGLGNDDDPVLAAYMDSTPRDPIAVRFAVPIGMHGVDDCGFCDETFFDTQEPTLQSIAVTAVSWLQGSHLVLKDGNASDDGYDTERQEMNQRRRQQWIDAEKHTSKRLNVIRQYADTMKDKASLLNTSNLSIRPEWIVPALRPCFVDAPTLDWKSLVTEVGPGIFAFPLFTAEFCNLLVQEVDSFEETSLPCRRPNTMNHLGLVVNDIGLEPFMTDIVQRLLAPMCKALYPNEMVTCALDHHHSFVVRYRNDIGNNNAEDGNKGLDMHHDASEATLNVCLGRDNFTSGGLRFCGRYGDANHRASSHVYGHTKGRAILHLGRHRHGADDIVTGERMNLIVWARNSAYRGAAAFGHVALDGSPHEKEAGEPDRLCLSKANDRDYEEQLKRFGSST